jgi:hypothetical protein
VEILSARSETPVHYFQIDDLGETIRCTISNQASGIMFCQNKNIQNWHTHHRLGMYKNQALKTW